MKPEAQRIAIAEAYGWTAVQSGPSKWGGTEIIGVSPSNKGKRDIDQLPLAYHEVPNYPFDLNAMQEAEKILTDEQRGQMMDALCEIVRRDHNPEAGPMTAIIAAFFATAAQRAEAFLRTLGLWKEESQ